MLWTPDIEKILNDVRENSVRLSAYHKKNYFYYKTVASAFRIPTIVISSIASVSSVGLSNYVQQEHISGIVCLLTLTIGIINSIELFLRIQDNLERELETSKSYYNLSIDLHKLLNLSQINRRGEPKDLLDTFYTRYMALVQESNLLNASYPDRLSHIQKNKGFFRNRKPPHSPSSSSSSSSESTNPAYEDGENTAEAEL
tara:strand:+ start:236 stop:835 length:600 start_codon:yes stop_codon:yes gene_type:complete